MLKTKKILLTSLLSAALLLQGCAGLIIGAGVGAASVAHDRRTIGTQVDDTTAASRISNALAKDLAVQEQTSITVQVFNGTALLVGQAPTQELIQQAQNLAATVKNIKKLHNQIRLGSPIPAGVIANDAWLASKIKTKLIADKRIDGLHIEIEVENGEVFLMGLVTEHESNIAVDITRNVNGVKQVIKAFEYT
ncbi:division/outer membrane stress-associated lipid-binding lipoprotein [Paraglaciecola arctica]|uniref:division/outer membrane stress-associated lipid-binding lipoprotein n=1 Tax=Paraglaciecola arctica TaxID=1128911 RepID=UPI001C06AFF2|nr:divisome-associated lipoprotein YraP [Paraglaciecola arctica]